MTGEKKPTKYLCPKCNKVGDFRIITGGTFEFFECGHRVKPKNGIWDIIPLPKRLFTPE